MVDGSGLTPSHHLSRFIDTIGEAPIEWPRKGTNILHADSALPNESVGSRSYLANTDNLASVVHTPTRTLIDSQRQITEVREVIGFCTLCRKGNCESYKCDR